MKGKEEKKCVTVDKDVIEKKDNQTTNLPSLYDNSVA